MFRHVLRNATRTLPLIFTLNASEAILTLAGLGFLGFGIEPTAGAEWGYDLNKSLARRLERHLVDGALPGHRDRARRARHHARRREPQRPRRPAPASAPTRAAQTRRRMRSPRPQPVPGDARRRTEARGSRRRRIVRRAWHRGQAVSTVVDIQRPRRLVRDRRRRRAGRRDVTLDVAPRRGARDRRRVRQRQDRHRAQTILGLLPETATTRGAVTVVLGRHASVRRARAEEAPARRARHRRRR